MKVKVSVLFWIKNGIAQCDMECEYHQVRSKLKWGFSFLLVAIFNREKSRQSQKKGKEKVVGSLVVFYVTLVFLLHEHIIPSIRTN